MPNGTDVDGRSPGISSGITVTGSGRAAAVPDVFVLVVGAEASSDRAAEATGRAGAALERIRSAALAHGVPADQLTTQNLVLRQGYDREGQPRGLVCELGLAVRSGEVARAGELVAACVEAGGDEARLQNASFEHSDPSALLVSARDSAFADARARASQLAGLAGRRLGPVERIVEGEPAWVPLHRSKAVALSSMPPMDAGTADVSVTVTVTWLWA
jgi:uncharacterized protein YggE